MQGFKTATRNPPTQPTTTTTTTQRLVVDEETKTNQGSLPEKERHSRRPEKESKNRNRRRKKGKRANMAKRKNATAAGGGEDQRAKPQQQQQQQQQQQPRQQEVVKRGVCTLQHAAECPLYGSCAIKKQSGSKPNAMALVCGGGGKGDYGVPNSIIALDLSAPNTKPIASHTDHRGTCTSISIHKVCSQQTSVCLCVLWVGE